jgi:uncharacterized membrane protein (DUF4010 family)
MALAPSLACAGAVALSVGMAFALRASADDAREDQANGAFNLVATLAFAAILGVISLGVAMLKAVYGEAGALAASAVGGFVDTHAAAASIASLVGAGRLAPEDAIMPILAGLSTNTVSKIVVAASRGRAFAVRVIPGLVAFAAAAWAAGLVASAVSVR